MKEACRQVEVVEAGMEQEEGVRKGQEEEGHKNCSGPSPADLRKTREEEES